MHESARYLDPIQKDVNVIVMRRKNICFEYIPGICNAMYVSTNEKVQNISIDTQNVCKMVFESGLKAGKPYVNAGTVVLKPEKVTALNVKAKNVAFSEESFYINKSSKHEYDEVCLNADSVSIDSKADVFACKMKAQSLSGLVYTYTDPYTQKKLEESTTFGVMGKFQVGTLNAINYGIFKVVGPGEGGVISKDLWWGKIFIAEKGLTVYDKLHVKVSRFDNSQGIVVLNRGMSNFDLGSEKGFQNDRIQGRGGYGMGTNTKLHSWLAENM